MNLPNTENSSSTWQSIFSSAFVIVLRMASSVADGVVRTAAFFLRKKDGDCPTGVDCRNDDCEAEVDEVVADEVVDSSSYNI